MSGFKLGYVYLTNYNFRWYIVQQTGQKSWVALVFTGRVSYTHDVFLKGNGASLYALMEKGENFKCHKFSGNSLLRRAMFNILKTGEIEDE